tara:strand:- start:860 stop:1297 length:438 start_codon:yes stop_codon:yes gene_type:complete
MKNDLKNNFYLLALEKELKFDIGKYENLIRPLQELKEKSQDVKQEIDALTTVLGYVKDKHEKISADIKVANANPKNHKYLGFTYKPKIYNIQGNVEISHDIYYMDKFFSYMPTNPENPHTFVSQKLFKAYAKYLDKIVKQKMEIV